MSTKNNQSLNERLARQKRVKRMKTGIIFFVLTWMMVCMLISVTMISKMRSLQRQIDLLTESTLRSQQVEQQEHQTQKNEEMESSDSAGGSPLEEGAAMDTESSDTDGEDTKVTDEDENVRKVYLTFDDGPSSRTRDILDVLDQYHVKATFFVTGREDQESLDLYQEIVARGHTIGMHSYSHKYSIIYDSLDAFASDLKRIQGKILEATGEECKLYRFPGGSSNMVSNIDMKEFVRYLNEQGITYFDWNVECGDATSEDFSVEELVKNVMEDVVLHHTSVVLMHDAEDKPRTVEALPKIIEQLQGMDDTQILPIDENTTLIQHVSADSVEE